MAMTEAEGAVPPEEQTERQGRNFRQTVSEVGAGTFRVGREIVGSWAEGGREAARMVREELVPTLAVMRNRLATPFRRAAEGLGMVEPVERNYQRYYGRLELLKEIEAEAENENSEETERKAREFIERITTEYDLSDPAKILYFIHRTNSGLEETSQGLLEGNTNFDSDELARLREESAMMDRAFQIVQEEQITHRQGNIETRGPTSYARNVYSAYANINLDIRTISREVERIGRVTDETLRNRRTEYLQRRLGELNRERDWISRKIYQVQTPPARKEGGPTAPTPPPSPDAQPAPPPAEPETPPPQSERGELQKTRTEYSAESDVGKVRVIDEDSFFAGAKGIKDHQFRLAKASVDEEAYEAAQKDPEVGASVKQTLEERKKEGDGKKKSVKENADKILENGVDGLFIITDGAGGHGAGENASQIAIEGILKDLAKTESWDKLSPQDVKAKIRKAVETANEKVFAAKQAARNDMQTTLTMAIVIGDNLYRANVGDSRVYLYEESSDTLKRVTKDHSLVEALVDAGQITDDERYTNDNRNVITRSIGDRDKVSVDVFDPIKITGRVKILAACDGLWEEVRDPQLKDILKKKPNSDITRELIDAANAAGGRDNITAIVAELNG